MSLLAMAKASSASQTSNLETVEALSPGIRTSPKRVISSELLLRAAQRPCCSLLGVHRQTSGPLETWCVPETLAGLCLPQLTCSQILSLVHGNGYHHFDPGWEGIKPEEQDYEMTVLKRMYHSFGPFPPSIADILDPDTYEIVHFLNLQGPPQRPLQRWSTKQIPSADNEFIRRLLKLDPRDRPTVEEILDDEWFAETSDDTRESGSAGEAGS
jgi:serine/threonine protein kinase